MPAEEPVLLLLHQNAGQYYSVLIANKPFRNAKEFKYLGTSVTNHNCND